MITVPTLADAPPASRREVLADFALAVGLGALITVGTYFASHNQPERRPFDGWTVALLLVAVGALAVRRRFPVVTLVLVFGSALLYFGFGYANGPVWLALIVAYFTAILRGHRLAAAIVAVLGFVTFPWFDQVLRDRPGPTPVALAGLAAWLLVLLGTAEFVRIRRERALEALRIKEEEALRRASEERLRIARELHDALGHHLSLINVQSGVALHLNERLPEPVLSSLTAIKEASKEALAELRSVLDILRQEGERAPRSPMSTLSRLHDLIAQSGAAGLDVRIETDGEERQLPFGVDVAAFRIVQEALTNVTRHAGPTTATVRLTYGQKELTVEIDNEGRGSNGTSPAGGGKGIQGMRERVSALGGNLEAGPRPEGGFHVLARLPLEGAK
jgi:signal transduction histidine kinase